MVSHAAIRGVGGAIIAIVILWFLHHAYISKTEMIPHTSNTALTQIPADVFQLPSTEPNFEQALHPPVGVDFTSIAAATSSYFQTAKPNFEALSAVFRTFAPPQGLAIVSILANFGESEYFGNFKKSLERVDFLPNLFLICGYPKDVEFAKAQGIAHYDCSSCFSDIENFPEVYRCDALKSIAGLAAAQAGLTIFISDMDVFFSTSDLTSAFCEHRAMEFLLDSPALTADITANSIKQRNLNAGVWKSKPTALSVKVLATWMQKLTDRPQEFGQGLLVETVRELAEEQVAGKFDCSPDDSHPEKVGFFDPQQLCFQFPFLLGVAARPKLVHFSGGFERPFNMRQSGTWLFPTVKPAKVMCVSFGTYHNLEEVMQQLGAAFVIAKSMSASLVTPFVSCKLHPYWEMMQHSFSDSDCPATLFASSDSILENFAMIPSTEANCPTDFQAFSVLSESGVLTPSKFADGDSEGRFGLFTSAQGAKLYLESLSEETIEAVTKALRPSRPYTGFDWGLWIRSGWQMPGNPPEFDYRERNCKWRPEGWGCD